MTLKERKESIRWRMFIDLLALLPMFAMVFKMWYEPLTTGRSIIVITIGYLFLRMHYYQNKMQDIQDEENKTP